MAYDSEHKTSAELQREVEQQRSQLENRIDQIQEKLSPGQLVDEVLAYTKGGGGEIVTNLQRQVTANPLPLALLGVSLAWLIAKPANGRTSVSYDREWDNSINRNRGYAAGTGDDYYDDADYLEDDYDDVEYPLVSISGSSLNRVSQSSDEKGNRFSEFADDAGRKFRAATDAAGRRAGHFQDEAGNKFRGFTDATGNRVQHFRDETGNLLEEASNWASDTWRMARERLHDARDAISSGSGIAGHRARQAGGALQNQAGYARDRAVQAGGAIQNQAGQLGGTLMNQFRDQPLVAGALAFAVGAALASALPHTRQEDEILGETSDKVKERLGEQAHDLYDQGRDKAAALYEDASNKVGGAYQKARDEVVRAADAADKGEGNTQSNNT